MTYDSINAFEMKTSSEFTHMVGSYIWQVHTYGRFSGHEQFVWLP